MWHNWKPYAELEMPNGPPVSKVAQAAAHNVAQEVADRLWKGRVLGNDVPQKRHDNEGGSCLELCASSGRAVEGKRRTARCHFVHIGTARVPLHAYPLHVRGERARGGGGD